MKKFPRAFLKEELSKRLIDQDEAISIVLPYLSTHMASLSSSVRPVGNFLLLGPTGVGKTETVQALAEVLHNNRNFLLRIDCGQFTQNHEVAKLIGSPPGYLGHRETPAILQQQKINSVVTTDCDLSIVLFDEIEKAHDSFFKVLLSILDKGELSIGDNTTTNFRKCLIFMTSNLGAKEMQDLLRPKFGFTQGVNVPKSNVINKLETIGVNAAKKKFSPEFFNRLDEVITYKTLSPEAVRKILKLELDKIRNNLYTRTKPKYQYLAVTKEVEDYLIKEGYSEIYGARELNRTIQRKFVQPLADLIIDSEFSDKTIIKAVLKDNNIDFEIVSADKLEINTA